MLLTLLLTSLFPTTADDSLHTVTLDEVSVVSTPKETGRLRQQPAAVSLISQETMAASHITSVKGASTVVPNLFIPDYGSRITSAVYLRGVGSRINTPAVALYVDNIPYSDKSAYDFNFHDIERIDVLRGPQGTLYGRNAMGGVIRVHTRNPFFYQGTDIKLGYATGDNHHNAAITHYHRPNDKVAFSIGGYYEGGSGLYENTTTGQDADRMKAGGGRVRAVYHASDAWKFDFTAYYDYSRERAYPYRYLGKTEQAEEDHPELIGSICNNRTHTYRRSLAGGGLSIEHAAPTWSMTAVTGTQFLRDRMFLDQDFIADDIYTLEQRQRLRTVSEELIFRSRRPGTRWQWLSGVSFLYQALHTEGPVTFYSDGLRWLEGNINGNMPDASKLGMLSAMGFTGMGIRFNDERLDMGGSFETPVIGAAAFHQSTLTLAPGFTATLGLRLDYEHLKMDYHAPSTVRYTFAMPNAMNDKMSVNLDALQSQLLYMGTLKDDHLKLLPKLALRYRFADQQSSVYASVAMGQRSGGYNLQMFGDLLQGALSVDMMQGIRKGVVEYLESLIEQTPSMPQVIPDPENPGTFIPLPEYVDRTMASKMPHFETPDIHQVVYKPEYSWNYEVGTHLDLCGGRLAADAAAFFVDTRNQQIARFADSGLGRMMVNAGRSHSCGVEVSAVARPWKGLLLRGDYGYTHAVFKKYDGGNGLDYTGNFVPFVPRHTLHADLSYTWNFTDTRLKAFTIGADVSGAGRIFWTEANRRQAESKSSLLELCRGAKEEDVVNTQNENFTPILGARAVADFGPVKVMLWGRNLTDARYDSFLLESAGRMFAQQAKPLQGGIDITIRL